MQPPALPGTAPVAARVGHPLSRAARCALHCLPSGPKALRQRRGSPDPRVPVAAPLRMSTLQRYKRLSQQLVGCTSGRSMCHGSCVKSDSSHAVSHVVHRQRTASLLCCFAPGCDITRDFCLIRTDVLPYLPVHRWCKNIIFFTPKLQVGFGMRMRTSIQRRQKAFRQL